MNGAVSVLAPVGDRRDVCEGGREDTQGLVGDSAVSLLVESRWMISSVITYSYGRK
jgi:hypothetical protein